MPEYLDLDGTLIQRPDDISPEWRVSCYPIAIREGRILMVEPVWAKRWELPGGGVQLENEETLIEASVRECREETGYRFVPDPTTLRFVGEQFFSVRSHRNWYHSLTFVVQGAVVGDSDPDWAAAANEIAKVAWLDLRDLAVETVQGFHWNALLELGLVS